MFDSLQRPLELIVRARTTYGRTATRRLLLTLDPPPTIHVDLVVEDRFVIRGRVSSFRRGEAQADVVLLDEER